MVREQSSLYGLTHKHRAVDATLRVQPEDTERLRSSNEHAGHGNGEGVAVGGAFVRQVWQGVAVGGTVREVRQNI